MTLFIAITSIIGLCIAFGGAVNEDAKVAGIGFLMILIWPLASLVGIL